MAQTDTNRDDGRLTFSFHNLFYSAIHNYESKRSEIRVSKGKVPKGHSFFAPRIEEEIIRYQSRLPNYLTLPTLK